MERRRSSVVERVIGNDEVDSSILSGGTRKPHFLVPFAVVHCVNAPRCLLVVGQIVGHAMQIAPGLIH
jgi:hypothetical protein